MKFVRGCLIAIAFLTFPLFLIVIADVEVATRESPELLGESARRVAESPEAREELVNELGSLWLEEHPEISDRLGSVGLEPSETIVTIFTQLAETESFVAELDRGATQFGDDVVSGRRPVLRLNFEQAIEDIKVEVDPVVVFAIQDFATIEATPLSDSDALAIQTNVANVRLYALFGAAISFLLLALLTLSLRHHIGSLFVAGMPALFLQRFLLNSLLDDPDPIDAIIGSSIVETWMPWTTRMMIVSAGALVVLIASYKLFPPGGSAAVPYAKGAHGLPPRPVILSPIDDDSYVFAPEPDHESLRQLSIVED